MTTRSIAIQFLSACLLLIVGATCPQTYEPPPGVDVPEELRHEMTEREADDIVHVIERRCVVCHACFDAPCQLVLTDRGGLQRGANKDTVYRSTRLRAAAPTRRGLDASRPDKWRELDFFSVTEGDENQGANLILSMLALGRSHTFEPDRPLPEEVSLDLDRSLSCPRVDEMGKYAADHPMGGMPYGMAPVTDWETALNEDELRQRVVARYVFEHWVFADLYFSSHPTGPFFEIVRSRTPPGDPIDVIATRFPYDDPGVEEFWYRLRRIHSIIAYKAHTTYEIGPKRLARYRELFLADDWTATRFPSWEVEEASNPFIAFEEIPAGARYQFLLDDAQYFIRSFIRGPVCRGQAATDVIQDRFFVSFLDPDQDISVQDATYLPELKDYLLLPAEAGSNMSLFEIWSKYDKAQTTYRKRRSERYAERFGDRGATLDLIWDGDGVNRDAMLTVFRNEDNATVVQGWVGDTPKTAWIIDYPVFERIYYNLVAGFDVFGNVAHQLAVRIYMDNLRMESEATFLALLPEDVRESISTRKRS